MQHNESSQNINNVILLEAYTDGLKEVFELSQDHDTEEEFYIALETMQYADVYNLASLIQASAKDDMWNDLEDDADSFEANYDLDALQQFAETVYLIRKALDNKSNNHGSALPYALETFAKAAKEITDKDYGTYEGHYTAHKAASDSVKRNTNMRKTKNPFSNN